MSESSHTARRRHEYMPNRMFDPVANPFAVQNLLVKEAQPFELVADERPDFSFESDPVVGKENTDTFLLDEVIELADLSGATDFSTQTGTDSGFVAESGGAQAGAAATGEDFVTDETVTAASTDGFTQTHAHDEPMDAAHAQAGDEATSLADAGTEAAGELAAHAMAAASEDAQANNPVADDAASTEAITAETATTEALDTEAAASIAPVAESELEPEPVPVAEAAAPTTPDLSSEAVTALVEAAREQARTETREQAYKEGVEAGKAAAKAELQQAHEAQITRLHTLQEALKKLSFDADALFEPVKKLTLHLAEQLVRGELTQSPQAISRLVDNSLRELNASGEKAVIVHLNPDDLEAYRPLVAPFGDSMILRPDALLERGSVRVALDGSVVEDLMQRRVEGLKKSLNQPPAPGWQAGGARLADRLSPSQRGSQQVEDVTAVETSGSSDVSDD